MKKQYFNMVEVLLALGVVVIGICSVMVLFPVGVSANRDATVLDDSSNVADQALHFIAYRFTNTFASDDTLWMDNLATIPVEGTSDAALSESDHNAIINKLDDSGDWDTESSSNGLFSGANFTDIFYQHKTYSQVFQVISHRNPTGVKLGDLNFKEELVDYRAIMVLTRKQIVFDENESGDDQKIDYKYGFTLNAEISWPAERPYSQRKVVNYTIDIYRNTSVN